MNLLDVSLVFLIVLSSSEYALWKQFNFHNICPLHKVLHFNRLIYLSEQRSFRFIKQKLHGQGPMLFLQHLYLNFYYLKIPLSIDKAHSFI